MKEIEKNLSDQSKFQKIVLKDDNCWNFITSKQKSINKSYKKLVDSNSMSEEIQKHLKPVGSRPGILYCFCKVRNKCVKSCPPFRPILSALKTPAH